MCVAYSNKCWGAPFLLRVFQPHKSVSVEALPSGVVFLKKTTVNQIWFEIREHLLGLPVFQERPVGLLNEYRSNLFMIDWQDSLHSFL